MVDRATERGDKNGNRFNGTLGVQFFFNFVFNGVIFKDCASGFSQ